MKKYKLTLEEINKRTKELSNNEVELATFEQDYCGKDSSLKFRHVCGFEFNRLVGNVIHNKVLSCPNCEPFKFPRTLERLASQLESVGYKLIDAPDGFGDRKWAMVEFKCGCQHNRNIGALLDGNVKCPSHTVGYNSQIDCDAIELRLKQLPYGNFSIYGHYKTTVQKCDFICNKCGHVENTKFDLIVSRGGKCKFCFGSAKSVAEEFLAILLKDLRINFIREYRLCGYYYDFYLPDRKILIEYDGEQHFKEKGSNLFAVENNDTIKDSIAEREGTHLLRLNKADCITIKLLELLEGSTTIPQGSSFK